MKNLTTTILISFLTFTSLGLSFAQEQSSTNATATTAEQPAIAAIPTAETKAPETDKKKKWYDLIALRGYIQVRYNRLFETNDQLKCDQCDKSWGENGGISIRRARLIVSGDVHERIYVYLQPDFASSVSGSTSQNFAQIRDAYFDVAFDEDKTFRARIGQSKVPFGFEILQSSQNRLALDRSDALNSAAANERDLGIFLYWAPAHIRTRFSELVSSGLKGSGDYGVAGLGAYNGQTANRLELNNTPHVIGHLTYPFQLSNGQYIEAGIHGYMGKYVMAPDQISAGVTAAPEYDDRRAAASFVFYPQPFGFQAEYNFGEGPEFDGGSAITEQKLHGGYGQIMYAFKIKKHMLIPYFRGQYYNGGKKHELDARSYTVKEYEAGLEWQPFKAFELVGAYVYSDRRFEDFAKPSNVQDGHLLRLQAQANF